MQKELLEDLSRLLEQQIRMLKEESETGSAEAETETETETLDVRTLKEGANITIDFENVTIKLKKLNSDYDYWIVFDARESKQLKNGDIVQFVKPNDSDSEPGSVLKPGRKVKFDILRKANVNYLSNKVISWHV